MSKKLILLLIATLVLFCAACGQAQETAEHAGQAGKEAGSALEKAAGEAGKMAEGLAEGAGDATGELLKKAKKAASSLDGEAREMYETAAKQLTEKQGELTKLKSKLAEMAPKDLLAGDGKKMKETAERLTSEIGDLEGKLREMIGKAG